jgi:iron-sulfur cluster repair protein YtfE (RIC family)
MQSMQSMQSMQTRVDSVQNKELLWTTLQESGAFTGLTRDQFQPVQAAFDRVVQQSAAAPISENASLGDANKHIIREFVQVLRSFQMPPQMPPKKKKVELVYRAEDIQNERASEFDRQLREKQAEMDSYLTLKKPTDVNFTDAGLKEDKPIGDEMSRLIAQELAARERELVQLKPEDIKKAQQWIGVTTDGSLPPKKSVSFSNMTNVVEEIEPSDTEENFEFEETASIFSKFKKIGDGLPEPIAAVITLQQVYEKLLELEQRMDANHAEIMEHLHSKGRVIGEP